MNFMPIHVHVLQEGAGVIYDCTGPVTIRDFLEVTKAFLGTPDETRNWRYTIIDLTSVGAMDIGLADVRTVVSLNLEIARFALPGVLLAVASPGDVGFGLACMWEMLAENTGWEIQVFRSGKEAEAWTRRRAREKFQLEITSLDPNRPAA